MKMDVVAVSVGGSFVCPHGPSARAVKRVARELAAARGVRFVISVGGGKTARDYIKQAREFTHNRDELDKVGIQVTRANARLMALALPGAVVVDTEEQLKLALKGKSRFVFMNNHAWRQTSDATAVEAGIVARARRFVNISDVAGVYTVNPKKHRDAKKLPVLSHKQLLGLARREYKQVSGSNFLIDLKAAGLLAKHGIEAHFVSGASLSDVRNALLGKKHSGSVVRS